jgi:hypothetical protein
MAPRVFFLSVLAAALAGLAVGCSADRAPEAADEPLQNTTPTSPLATASSDAPRLEMSPQDLERLARGVLAERYGEAARDETLDCWRDEAEGGVPYCMRLTQVARVEEAGQSVLYVLASNINRFDAPDYQYAHADSGRAAAFTVTIDPDGSLGDLIASGNGFAFGSNGNCGCEDARMVRLGAERHAWHFVSGGIWQGIVVTNHVLLARTGDGFVDVSEIPEVSEDDQLHRISIAVDEGDSGREQFPIIVTKRAGVEAVAADPSSEGEEVARWVVIPSGIDGIYRLPDGGVAGQGAGERP